MSSFDPDDTTPLINNQEANSNHGTFTEGDDEPLVGDNAQNENASDDEILDSRQPSVLQRFNPFDRVPNLPPQLQEELGGGIAFEEPSGAWHRFKR